MLKGMPDPIRVVIADAYPIVRTGLIISVESDPQMKVVGTATHYHNLFPQLRTLSVDVVVINLVGMSETPITTLRKLKKAHPTLGTVGFAAVVDSAPELLVAGMHAYIAY